MGYHGASTRSIGAAAELTIGAVHHHFGSKSDLYIACVEEADARIRDLIQRATAAATVGGLEGAARAAVEGLRDQRVSLAIRLVARKVWEDPEGEIAERLKSHGGSLDRGAATIATMTQMSPLRARIRVQAAIFILARFALSPAHERKFVTGMDSVDEATVALEDELVSTLLHIITKP